MNQEIESPCFAVLCNAQGMIEQILKDEIGLENLQAGSGVETLLDSQSRIKFFNFLASMRAHQIAVDWEVILPMNADLAAFQLVGAQLGDRFIIVGAPRSMQTLTVLEELVLLNNEQTNSLRAMIKDQVQQPVGNKTDDVSLFNEISRLNNELITLQRDLAKKNAELERLYAQVQQQASRDPLTGIYNRRGFFELGEREVLRAHRYRHPLTALMFDLDHFKSINDTYGHQAGDQVLVDTARRCSQELRNVDILGRYGGDEFLILLPDTPADKAEVVAQRLHHTLSQTIHYLEKPIQISISMGIAVLQESNNSLEMLLKHADQALYQAKKAGRNRYHVLGESILNSGS